ncbi:MAG: flagellar filament capping protein FliD [Planctomycetaceae bacterium]|nr:flagellar filament capping protein FliD [Planctomycetaceae bacterium]
MSGISSSIGLISGIDYTSLVNQLMQIEAIPITNLQNRTTRLEAEESAYSNLITLFLTTSYMVNNLNKPDVYKRCEVSSSNTSLLTVSPNPNGTPVPGVYTFTPVKTASAQQTISQGVSSATTALGKTGTITIGKQWSLDQTIYLQDINGGDGFEKGYIRVTDGSGTRATIDLRQCVTMSDVIDAINNNRTADVWAELDGDKLVLSDLSGGTGDVKIQEVSNGRTAASLGFTTSNSSGNEKITSNSIYKLGENTRLSILNDGNGVIFDNYRSDLVFTCKDGTIINVDFNKMASSTESGSTGYKEQTIGDLINTINTSANNNGKIIASIGDDGRSLKLTDTTIKYTRGDLVEGTIPPEYTLPSVFDSDDYELDEYGFVKYKTGEHAGEFVADTSATTKVGQNALSVSSPILQSLGLMNMNESNAVGFSFSEASFQGRSIIGSLDSPLVATLNGGYGIAGAIAGDIEVQDRAGNKATLTFSAAEVKQLQSGTLNEAIALLNSKMESASWVDADENAISLGDNVGITIEKNQANNGLRLIDKSGATTHDMIFRDVESTHQQLDSESNPVFDEDSNPVMVTESPKIAELFGLNIGSTARSSVNGASLNKQIISFNTKLSELNGGKGVTLAGGQIRVTDSSGASETFYIDAARHTTVGEIIDGINSLTSLRVYAKINETGDGIELVDNAGGTGRFIIEDGGSSRICRDLGIAGTVDPSTLEAGKKPSLSGGTTFSIDVEEKDTLMDIRDKINALGGQFTASILTDGSNTPHRLVITGKTTGAAGAFNIDLSVLGLTTQNLSEAQDAVLVYGDSTSNAGATLTSSSNTFKNIINGIDLTITGTSDSPVTITSAGSSADVKASIQAFVDNYNRFREQFNKDTYYSVSLNAGNILYSDSNMKRFGSDIAEAILKQVDGIPGINSIQSLGVTIRRSTGDDGINTETGKLVFDDTVFDALWESNPEGVQEFFNRQKEIADPSGERDEDGNIKLVKVSDGWAQKFMDVANTYTGTSVGKLYKRLETLGTKIDNNYERINYMSARLETRRTLMLKKFYQMEQAMAKMSADMNSVANISTNWQSYYSSNGSSY